MGTNYYFHLPAGSPCPTCGREYKEEVLHMGKSSAGWTFALHVIPEIGLNSLAAWEKYVATHPEGILKDEYDREVSWDEFVAVVTERAWDRDWDVALQEECPHRRFIYDKDPRDRPKMTWQEFFDMNHAEPGPHGLLRSRINQSHCIAYGEGTWDLVVGEFS